MPMRGFYSVEEEDKITLTRTWLELEGMGPGLHH